MVAVPLGPRLIRGVVAGLRDGTGHNRPLKAVQAVMDDPALPEAGVPAMDLEIWNAMVVPASMPKDIADAISAALSRIIRSVQREV